MDGAVTGKAGMGKVGMDEAGPGTAEEDPLQPLFGVLEIVDGQRAAVQAALEGLAAERAALGRERERLARQVQDVQLLVQGTVRRAVADSLG